MHLFISISIGGGGYMYRLSVPVCRECGLVYDLNIECKIALSGNAIIKNICYRLFEIVLHVTKCDEN